MTAPRSELDYGAVEEHEQGFRRQLLGLLLILAGAVALLWVLASVDWRLPIGVGALAAIAGGLWLGRDQPDDERE